MARPIRIEYPGAVYHVITRGNNRQSVFKDERDRSTYLEKLFIYCEQKEVEVLCYCLLTNHVHLLLETPKGNLSKLMQPLQTSYTVYFNKRHRHTGHVFEQRYKAFLVDKDNYLLQVSRYIHLNPVAARVVDRPQDYRWSSYHGYVKGKGAAGLNRDLVLGQFEGRGRKRAWGYRDFVEGGLKRKEQWSQFPIIKKAFVGDEEFVEQARKKVKREPTIEGHYGLGSIVQVVCKVTGLERDELRRAAREERVQRGREVLMYVARRYSDAGLREISGFLGAKELSTVTHGVRRAEIRLKEEQGFRRQVEEVLKKLSHSLMQA